MKLPYISVKRPVTVLMGVAIVIVLGLVSFSRLPIDLFPDMETPIYAIMTNYSDAGPAEVETLVTIPIEEALGTVTNIKNTSSVSSRGVSLVIAEFNWGTDMDFAGLEVREKIDLVEELLPDEAGTPTIIKFDPNSMPIMQLVLNGDRTPYELRYIAEHEVKHFLERLEGVASVSVSGGQEREIRVILHPGLLRAHGVAIETVGAVLRAANMNQPAGTVMDNSREYVLRTSGEFKSLDEICNLRIPTRGGGSVRLADIAEVSDGYKETRQISRFNGRASVMLSIQKESGANTVQVAKAVRRAVADLADDLGRGLSLQVALDSAQYIEKSIASVTDNAISGGLLAMLVLLLFLGRVAPTVVIGLSIPISIVATAIMIYFSHTTLNMISLGGLALGVGMLVDNSIVVLENIVRRQDEEGEDALTASYLGAEQVGAAITASTLTTVVVFLPVVFVTGMIAELMQDMALTVTFSLLASLLVSMTLVPMLSSQLLLATNRDRRRIRWLEPIVAAIERLQASYVRALRIALGRRGLMVLGAFLTLAVSLALLPRIGMEFIPGMDQGQIQVSVTMPKGTPLAETNQVVASIENFAAGLPEVKTITASVGGGGMWLGTNTTGESGSVGIELVAKAERQRSVDAVMEDLRKFAAQIPGAKIGVSAGGDMMVMAGSPVQIELRADDLDLLRATAEELTKVIKEIPGTREVTNSLEESQPEIAVVINRDKAAAYGLNVSSVASVLRTAVDGQTVTKFRSEGKEIDVTVQLAEDWRRNPADVGSIPIITAFGSFVPLRDVAELQAGYGPVAINRDGQSRVVTVTSQIAGRDLGSVMADVRRAVAEFSLPNGVLVEFGGQNEQMTESFAQLGLALVLGALLVFMILAAEFESLLQPFTIMLTVPLAVIGVVLGLLVGGAAFSVTAFIGAIMLVGIVVNNAIVLIEYVNQLRASGVERTEALLEAGRTRLRPILMTTLTTVLGMLPLALAGGEGSELTKPIAYVVIGGLSTSTLLTLFMIPVFYTYMDNLSARIMRLMRRAPAYGGEARGTSGSGAA